MKTVNKLLIDHIRKQNTALIKIHMDSSFIFMFLLVFVLYLFVGMSMNGYTSPSFRIVALLIIKQLFKSAMDIAEAGY